MTNAAALDHAAIRAQVRRLKLRAHKTVTQATIGAFRSAFRSRGVEFQEIREYVPGDDVRAIDWNVTARFGRPHLKRFSEEREQTLLFLVDGSASLLFGAKRETAAGVFAALALAASVNNDQAGLIMFTSEIEHHVPPAKGVVHVERLIRDLVAFQPRCTGTDLSGALEFVMKVRRRRSFVILLTDFLARGFERSLRLCANRHELVAVSVIDRCEQQLPDCGLMDVEDPESGLQTLIDTSDPNVRAAFAAASRQRRDDLKTTLRSAAVDHLEVETGHDFFPDLVRFLEAHAKNY